MLFARYRAMPPWEKVRMVSELSKASYEWAQAGVRLRYPGATEEQVRLILAVRRLGHEVVRRAIGREPELPGK